MSFAAPRLLKKPAETPASEPTRHAPDLEARVNELLKHRLSTLKMPPDLLAMHANRSLGALRRITAPWCYWVAGINLLTMGFDIGMTPARILPTILLLRFGLSCCFAATGWALQTNRFTRHAYILLNIPCLLTVIVAGVAGYATSNDILVRAMNFVTMMDVTAITFVTLDLKFSLLLAATSLPLISIFLLFSNLQPGIAKLQVIAFTAVVTSAVIWGRYIQNLMQYRLFLLNLREELWNSRTTIRNAELSSFAYTDPLTEIPNRRYFEEICASMTGQTKNLLPLTLCMIDIDYFKKLNDKLGHLQGDRCLRLVATTIRNNLRNDRDIVARYGGEEFVLLLPGTNMNRAWEVAERIRAAISELNHPNPGSPYNIVTASIGVAERSLPAAPLDIDIDIETLLLDADHALYRAKTSGRNRVNT